MKNRTKSQTFRDQDKSLDSINAAFDNFMNISKFNQDDFHC